MRFSIQTINAAFCFTIAIANASTAIAQEIINIGLSSPLSGPQASAGKDNENGANMAIAELNKKQIVIAGKSITFQLLAEDDQADPKIGIAVAQKLITAKIKAVLGPYNSGVAIPVSKYYNDARIVMATVGTNPRITQQGFQYVFRLDPNDNQLGGDMAIYAAKRLHLKKVAVIDDRTAYGEGVADAFLAAAKASKINIAGRKFSQDKPDEFNTILTAIKNLQVDGIFYGGYFAQAAILKRQMKQLGIDATLMGGDAICNAETGKLAGSLVNDKIYCVQGGTILGARSSDKNFLADYHKLYGKAPSTYAPYFYDGMKMIAAAMQKADSTDPVKFSTVLAAMHYVGVVGDYAFDAGHDLKNSPVTIYQFKDGKPVAVPFD